MASIQFIPIGFRQTNNICLLASFSFVLGYYKKLEDETQEGIDVYNVCNKYMHYLLQLPENALIRQNMEADYNLLFNINHQIVDVNNYERFVSMKLHSFCHNRNMRGLDHIKAYDDYLFRTGDVIRCHNFSIEDGDVVTNTTPIPDAPAIIMRHLDDNENNLAMIVYLTQGNGHSVLVGKNNQNGDYFFRDPNQDNISAVCSHVNLSICDMCIISEYILFSAIT